MKATFFRILRESNNLGNSSISFETDESPKGLRRAASFVINIISHANNTRSNSIFLNMIIDLNLGVAISACGFDVEHVPLIPIGVVDLVEPIIAGVEQILGVHDIVEDGIDLDVGWQIDYLNVHQFQLPSFYHVEVFEVKLVVLLWIDDLGLRELVLPKDPQLLTGYNCHIVHLIAACID
jgi:hypothetical protein